MSAEESFPGHPLPLALPTADRLFISYEKEVLSTHRSPSEGATWTVGGGPTSTGDPTGA